VATDTILDRSDRAQGQTNADESPTISRILATIASDSRVHSYLKRPDA